MFSELERVMFLRPLLGRSLLASCSVENLSALFLPFTVENMI
jgi:hypothetical protein